MTDREIVIKWLDGLKEYFHDLYAYQVELDDEKMADKAIELLKNSPVKPRLIRDWYVCECGASITMQVDGEPFRKSQYCCACGKPVDWT